MILVTGASGIVGSQIVRQLVDEKKTVRALKRESSDISWLENITNSIDWVDADILDFLSLEKAFEGVTYVVHCAAIVSFDNSNDALMHEINVEGTKNILALCEKYKVQKLVYISSVAALGRSSKTTLITEDAKWIQSSLNTNYAVSKYHAELEVWRAQEEGLQTVILNPSIVIGPGNWSNSSLNLFKYVKNGAPFCPEGSLNYVDVRDVAIITSKFIFNDIQAERFIINAGMISYEHFFKVVAKTMNKKAPNLKLNPTLAIFVASILKVVRFLTGIKTNITKEAVILSRLNILFAADKVEKTLGFKFRAIEDSIQWTYKQLKP